LIEGGYMTHPVERKKIYDAVYRRQMALAMVKGILAYQRLVSPSPVVPATNRPVVKIPPSSWTGTNKISTNNQMR